MAYPASFTLGTGNKISVNYQSQEVHVSVTYQLERDDTDLLAVAAAKAPEVEKVHRLFWKQVREASNPAEPDKPKASPNGSPAPVPPPASTTPTAAPPVSEGRAMEPAVDPPVSNGNGASPMSSDGHTPPNGRVKSGKRTEPLITEPQLRALAALQARQAISDDDLKKRMEIRFGKSKRDELTELQATNLLLELQRNGRGQRPTFADSPTDVNKGDMTNGNQARRAPAAVR